MGVGHDHSHGGPSHGHDPTDFGKAFAVGIALNLGFVAIEFGYGVAANSMALIADAGHNLSDVLGLLVAGGAALLSKRSPGARFTYGLRKSSVLAALLNAVFLLLAVGAIGFEAFRRLGDPQPVAGETVVIVALIGIAVNGLTAFMFARGRHGDINISGAYLHMAADAAVSAGVVVAGLMIAWTDWQWIDPAVSLAVAALILIGTWGLLRDSVGMALDAVPPGIDANRVEAGLAALPGVSRVHDLHIWPMSTTEPALTCHLVIPGGNPGDAFLKHAADMLHADHGIGHVTIQIETALDDDCRQAPHGSI